MQHPIYGDNISQSDSTSASIGAELSSKYTLTGKVIYLTTARRKVFHLVAVVLINSNICRGIVRDLAWSEKKSDVTQPSHSDKPIRNRSFLFITLIEVVFRSGASYHVPTPRRSSYFGLIAMTL